MADRRAAATDCATAGTSAFRISLRAAGAATACGRVRLRAAAEISLGATVTGRLPSEPAERSAAGAVGSGSGSDIPAGTRIGHPDGPDGRAPLERGKSRDEHAEDPSAWQPAQGATGFGQDRPRHRQRHRHPRRAGLASPCDVGARPQWHRDPRRAQHQRHVRQRRTRRIADAQRRRRGHHRQRRPGLPGWHAGAPHRDRSRHPHRRSRGARRDVDDREQQDTAGQHLDRGAPWHADRRHRPFGCRQVDLRAVGRRVHASDHGHGDVRGSQRARRVRLTALQNRHGAAGRRRARPADRAAGADVCRRTTVAAGHHEGRSRTGRHAGPRGTRDDQPPGHPRRQALRRPAQARIGGTGAADRPVAADPRRADLRSGSRAGPPGHDDASPTCRRGPRGAGRHALAELPRRLRSGAAAGAGRQDGVLRHAKPDRRGDGHHQLGRHLQQRRRRSRTPPRSATSPSTGHRPRPRRSRLRPTSASRHAPACENSSPRSLAARCD